jgi:hypothetical protein
MFDRARWLALAALAGGWLLAVVAPAAHAQPYNPYLARQQFAQPAPYWGYMQFPNNPPVDVGDVLRAYGDLMIKYQQARSARLDVRRKELEQWMWERDTLPNSEDERERQRRLEVQRARLNPPKTEIWSGKALNELLTELRLSFSLADSGEGSPPLPSDLLRRVNVSSGKAGGNAAVFRERRLAWPMLLQDPSFAEERQRADEFVTRAFEEATQGRLTLDTVGGLRRCYVDLDKRLTDVTRSDSLPLWSPTMYFQARQFLHRLEAALSLMDQEDAPRFLLGTFRVQAKTVAELVRYMTENGLQFAEVTPGDETAYTALHAFLSEQVRRRGTDGRPKGTGERK